LLYLRRKCILTRSGVTRGYSQGVQNLPEGAHWLPYGVTSQHSEKLRNYSEPGCRGCLY